MPEIPGLGNVTLAQVIALRATNSFRQFIQQAWPFVEPAKAFIPSWHIDAIADHLQAVSEGSIRRLLINVPPGHAKSLIVSVLWPAWQWIKRPMWRGLFSSYADELSIRDSVRCRALLETPWYRETFRPKWDLSGDQNVKSWFENTAKGVRLSLSVGGKGTGFRGDCIVVDDPLNAKEQFSDNALDSCIFWWDQVMSSRLNDMATGSKVIIMQRLSERDLAAHVIAQGGYEHLNLPSEFDPERRSVTSIGWSDPRNQSGELLFPALFPEQVIEEIKRDLGPQGYAAQHQQRPSPEEGGVLKRHWWRYYQHPGQAFPPVTMRVADGSMVSIAAITIPEIHEVGQSWDCAFKDTKTSDFVVGQAWGKNGADRFLLEQDRARRDLPSTLDAVRNLTGVLLERFPGLPQSHTKLIEDKANGSAVIQSLQHEIAGLIPVNPEGGKMARAAAVSPQVASGNVYLPHPLLAPWVKDFIEECASFPNGVHDDQMDAATQLLRYWKTGSTAMFPGLRLSQRALEPASAVHVSATPELKHWWQRWISVTAGAQSSAHWWVREPSGRTWIYRELLMSDSTPEEFGAAIAARTVEIAGTRMIPVWLHEKAFERAGGKSVAALVYAGITKALGATRAFLDVHTDDERAIEDPALRIKALESRIARMPSGFLSVQALKGKDQNGWDTVREMLRWRDKAGDAPPPRVDWDHAKRLAATDAQAYSKYIRQFTQGAPSILPILRISSECPALIQAMSGAVRSTTDESALAQNSQTFLLQSLRIGAMASRELQATEPVEEFVGRRMDAMPANATGISMHLAQKKAEGDWANRFQSKPMNFARVRRPGQ